MTGTFFNSFFIKNIRSKELKKRMIELTGMRTYLLESKREPVIKRTRTTKTMQPVLDDYHKLVQEYNLIREGQVLMMDLIIGLSYLVDLGTNPTTNDELFSFISKGAQP